jgi:hypothetical protein
VNLRPAFAAFGLGFLMLVACITSFGLNAPTVVGALFLVAFVACGVVGFLLGMRSTSRFKAQTRAAQRQQAQGRDPWQD